jgi:hypothetical protein
LAFSFFFLHSYFAAVEQAVYWLDEFRDVQDAGKLANATMFFPLIDARC